MSGYTNSALLHQGAMEDGRSFLQKPFSPDLLRARYAKCWIAPSKLKPLNGGRCEGRKT